MLAERFSATFARAGCAVVSGLAFGIDAAAHKGSLRAGGLTIAVLAHGLERICPASHAPLGKRILEDGGLVSEHPADTPLLPYNFITRNRIISGLSDAVLVIEAPMRSGSLATARFAVEQNRGVYVTPGPAIHRNYEGSHALIREGAMLVTRPEEILEDLGVDHRDATDQSDKASYTEDEGTVLQALREAGCTLDMDEIASKSGIPIEVAHRAITMLVVGDAVKEHPGGRYAPT